MSQRTRGLEHAGRDGDLSGFGRYNSPQYGLLRRFRHDVPVGIFRGALYFCGLEAIAHCLPGTFTGGRRRGRETAGALLLRKTFRHPRQSRIGAYFRTTSFCSTVFTAAYAEIESVGIVDLLKWPAAGRKRADPILFTADRADQRNPSTLNRAPGSTIHHRRALQAISDQYFHPERGIQGGLWTSHRHLYERVPDQTEYETAERNHSLHCRHCLSGRL